jgi:hypothetical protein
MWKIIIQTQYPQSPDVNVHDLWFFAGIKAEIRDREQMMKMIQIQSAYRRYPAEYIDGIWGCLFNKILSIMKYRASN